MELSAKKKPAGAKTSGKKSSKGRSIENKCTHDTLSRWQY
jgi:hypothetical protein